MLNLPTHSEEFCLCKLVFFGKRRKSSVCIQAAMSGLVPVTFNNDVKHFSLMHELL